MAVSRDFNIISIFFAEHIQWSLVIIVTQKCTTRCDSIGVCDNIETSYTGFAKYILQIFGRQE